MMVKIAHASIDERGKISGGQAGDQTGKEVCIRTWYNKPWNCVIRFKLPAMRQKLADFMRKVANNPYVGYDQQNRNSLLQYARNVGYDPSKINTPCEGDCSSTVTVGCIYAGLQEKQLVINGNCATTRTLRNLLKNTGMVDIYMEKDYTATTENLIVGDILLSEGHHVAVVVGVDNSNPYPEPTKNIRLGSRGDDVKWLQYALNEKGHYGLVVDGIAGQLTIGCLIDFQKKAFPSDPKQWDGICGTRSRAMLKQ